MHLSRSLATGIVLALVLMSMPLVPSGGGTLRIPVAGAQDDCELVANGDFALPDYPDLNYSFSVTPASWSGSVIIANYPSGQTVIAIFETLSQVIPTAGLDGQTLTAWFDLYPGENGPTTVTLGETSQTFALDFDSQTLRQSLSYTLPNPAPPTTTLSFSVSLPVVDNVSVTASGCTDQAPIADPNPVALTTAEDTSALLTISATDPDGDSLTYAASDPAKGSVTGIGPDFTYLPDRNAFGADTFTVTVSDGTRQTVVTVDVMVTAVNDPPVLADGPDVGPVEATGPGGAVVLFARPSATDPDLDDDVTVTCVPASGTTFAIGSTTVTCTADDGAGKRSSTDTSSFTVTVVDTTAPSLTIPASITVEATSPSGANVPFAVSAADLVDGSRPVVCRASGDLVTSPAAFPVGTTKVSCTATDTRGNASAAQTFTVTVRDRSGPAITWVGGPQPNQIYTRGTLPGEPTCTATDAASEVTQCRLFGYSTAEGTHTLTARARDTEGNSSVSTRTYTVVAGSGGGTLPTATPTKRPTATPVPNRPTATPTQPPVPTAAPTRAPRPTATAVPAQPTAVPTQPAVQPTAAPTRPPRR